jgi:hypothetical protein
MSKVKAFLAGLAMVSLLVVGGFTAAKPALALSHVGPAGYASFWDGCGSAGVGYCGAAWPIPVQTANVCHNVPTGSNDKWTAVDNNTTHDIVLYANAGCNPSGGSSWRIYAGTMTGQMGSGANNAVSSYSWR